jgi:hypothetical protein
LGGPDTVQRLASLDRPGLRQRTKNDWAKRQSASREVNALKKDCLVETVYPSKAETTALRDLVRLGNQAYQQPSKKLKETGGIHHP